MQKVVNNLLTTYHVVHPEKKQTLLILHGWGQNSSHWLNVIKNLPQNFTGIALDLPAFGSTQPLPGVPAVEDYSKFTRAFIDKLQLKNVTLMGHSFGGQIAVDFSLRFPESLKHMILVSPACIRQSSPNRKSLLAKKIKPLFKLLPVKIYRRLFEKIASENYLLSNSTQRRILNKIIYQDYSKKLKNINTPTSIIWGDKDFTIENNSKIIAEIIPDSHLSVLYGADHNPHLTSETKFLLALNIILSQNVV